MNKRYDYITPEDYETAEQNGISEHALEQRVRDYGWDIDRAITQPVRVGESFQPIWEKWEAIATKNNISRERFYDRVRSRGWPEERAATEKVQYGRGTLSWTSEQLEHLRLLGLNENTVRMRINKLGWSKEKALNTPKMTREERAKRVAEGTKKYHERRKKDGTREIS